MADTLPERALTREFEREFVIPSEVAKSMASDTYDKVQSKLENPPCPKCGGAFSKPVQLGERVQCSFCRRWFTVDEAAEKAVSDVLKTYGKISPQFAQRVQMIFSTNVETITSELEKVKIETETVTKKKKSRGRKGGYDKKEKVKIEKARIEGLDKAIEVDMEKAGVGVDVEKEAGIRVDLEKTGIGVDMEKARIEGLDEAIGVDMEKAGIEGLDEAIGGLPNKSVILLVGEPGCKNTTFAQQVLWNHSELGGKTTYYMVGTTRSSIRQGMMTYGWQLDNVIKAENWDFVNVFSPGMSDPLVNLALSDQEKVAVKQDLNALKGDFLPRAQQGHWTVFDSVTFLLQEYSPKEVFSLVRYLTVAAHLHGGIHFLICYEGVQEENILNTLRLLADGVIEFSLKEGARGVEGSLFIKKMPKSLRTKIIPFSMSERGITIETAVRIA